jgi:hypothetical protein
VLQRELVWAKLGEQVAVLLEVPVAKELGQRVCACIARQPRRFRGVAEQGLDGLPAGA